MIKRMRAIRLLGYNSISVYRILDTYNVNLFIPENQFCHLTNSRTLCKKENWNSGLSDYL